MMSEVREITLPSCCRVEAMEVMIVKGNIQKVFVAKKKKNNNKQTKQEGWLIINNKINIFTSIF